MTGPVPAAGRNPLADAGDGTGLDLRPDLPPGLPPGVIELAMELCRQLPTPLVPTTRGSRPGSAILADLLTAPLRLDDEWPGPESPRAVPGGWVQPEVIDEDRELLDSVLDRRCYRGPEEVARSCQELRLPVSPYRPLPPPPTSADRPPDTGTSAGDGHSTTVAEAADPDRVATAVVVDLSTHWAGPLATKLLAEAGATVIKLDPRSRPDGFGSRPGLYHHLNGDKDLIDLDLRAGTDRQRFESLLAEADLIVESFSRRVMTNLGYGPSRLKAINPALSTLSVKAYPAGTPEETWLAFGPGVHACSGLGLVDGTPRPSPVAYPDFLTGLAGLGAAVELLGGSSSGNAEVSLQATIEPLVTAAAEATGEEADDG